MWDLFATSITTPGRPTGNRPKLTSRKQIELSVISCRTPCGKCADSFLARRSLEFGARGESNERIGTRREPMKGATKAMPTTHWSRIREVFENAVELESDEQRAYVERECAGAQELIERVLLLLGADTGPPGEIDLAEQRLRSGLEPTLHGGNLIGERVGSFSIGAAIAAGGMGTIYEAFQENPARRVALKVLRRGLESRNAVRRFRYESSILARLRHPGIAQVFEAGSFEDTSGPIPVEVPYFAMEFIEGAHTFLVHAEEEDLDLTGRIKLFIEVCDIVHYGHGMGVIHRDLKPGNILVGSAGKPVVIDFGVARVLAAAEGDETTGAETQAGEVLGTLRYMSPEQISGQTDQIGTATDVYSLGVVLYELLCGASPYVLPTDSNLFATARIIQSQAPTPPTSVRPELPRELDWILNKALEKQAADRYGSCHEFAADLERYLEDEPLLVGPPSATYKLRKLLQRHRSEAILVGALLLAAIGIPLFYSVSLNQLNEELRSSNDRYGRLADAQKLRELKSKAELLWPAQEELVAEMDVWLNRAKTLLARRSMHEETLEQLHAELSNAVSGSEESMRLAWQADLQADLVQGLFEFESSGEHDGGPKDIARRLEAARSLRRLSIEEPEQQWLETTTAIAQSTGNPYQGLTLAPQLGLIPLGPDPYSGLHEFAHLPSGAVPNRSLDGQLLLEPGSSIVFVLLPGGRFRMGTELAATEGLRRDDYYDEQPANPVTLSPFFLSKYELTQGQWLRMTGRNPSALDAGLLHMDGLARTREAGLLHPVESVSWDEASVVLGHFALALPTEAQWEYAARAGTTELWWMGDNPLELIGKVNLADRSAAAFGEAWDAIDEWPEFEDGYPYHAPVSDLAANPFGLFGVAGNVYEWCRDSYAEYNIAATTGDGLRGAEGGPERMMRGGCFALGANQARSAARSSLGSASSKAWLGLRPMRPID